ncbi:MAG: hypothetical protein HZY75_13240 [Nocardioidaceae bacterium]|nr:MAG: hypothetical protein HZY75_13240 [Nocardioidaceae bacterium]
MARIRTIKPDFWTDEAVVELDFADRLLFIGLWNFADDQGYLDYRPKRVKMQVFPADDYDVVAGLKRLWESSLVSLYTSNQGLIVYINGWDKHQRVSNPAKERFSSADLHVCGDFDTAVQSPREDSRVLGKGREGKGSISSSDAADAAPDPATPRDDVERLCDRLADRIEANGSKRPAVTQKWRDAARRMLDNDKRTEEQIAWIIDWCQRDEFWRSNILSMPKVREKFDQIRLKAVPPANVTQLPTGPDGHPVLPPPRTKDWLQ